jgi:hypothetical protein
LLFHFQPLENADGDQKKGGWAKEGMKQTDQELPKL